MAPENKNFLGVYFVKCSVYGRLYKNSQNTFYLGRCPKCGCPFKVKIGSEGLSQRFFQAVCK